MEDRPSGFVVWFTGLSGAGKTTLARLLGAELERRGHLVDLLDGEDLRARLSPDLGFSREDRDVHVERLGWFASRLGRAGAIGIVSAISPFEEARTVARTMVEAFAPFVCVHVATPLAECARRDDKGLYARAYAGEIADFTGVSAPYEAPSSPDLRIDTSGRAPADCVREVVALLEQRGLVAPADEPHGVSINDVRKTD